MFEHSTPFSGFSVDDIQAAQQFYGKTLGLAVSESNGLLEVSLGSARVVVYPKANHTPATFTILNFPVKDIDRAVTQLVEAGVHFEVYPDGNLKTDERGIFRGRGPTIAWFRDPAGNFLSVIETT